MTTPIPPLPQDNENGKTAQLKELYRLSLSAIERASRTRPLTLPAIETMLTDLLHQQGVTVGSWHFSFWSEQLFTFAKEHLTPQRARGQSARVVLGRNTERDELITLPAASLSSSAYVLGGTGTGKTSGILVPLALQAIERGEGVILLDPHGTAIDDVLARLPDKRLPDVVYIQPGRMTHPIGINPLTRTGSSRDADVNRLMDIFKRLWGFESGESASWGARMEGLLRACITVLIHNNLTIAEMPYFFNSASFRKRVYENIPDTLADNFTRYYFEEDFEKHAHSTQAAWSNPILNKVYQLLTVTEMVDIVSQQKSTLDFARLMDEQKIILLHLSENLIGRDAQRFLGTLFIAEIIRAAFSRTPGASPLVTCIIDEFAQFSSSAFVEALPQVRKFNVGFILAGQTFTQLEKEEQGAVKQLGTQVTFACSPEDAKVRAIIHARSPEPIYQERDKPLVILEAASHILSGTIGYEVQTVIEWLKQWSEVYKSAREVRGNPGGNPYTKEVGRRLKRFVTRYTRLNPYYWIVQDSREELTILNEHLYELMYEGQEIRQGRAGDPFIPLPVSLLRRIVENKPELTELFLEGERDTPQVRSSFSNFSLNFVSILLDLAQGYTECDIPLIIGRIRAVYTVTKEELDDLWAALFIAKTETELQTAHENYAAAIKREWKDMLLFLMKQSLYSVSLHFPRDGYVKGTPEYAQKVKEEFEAWKNKFIRGNMYNLWHLFPPVIPINRDVLERIFTFEALQWEYTERGTEWIYNGSSWRGFLPERYEERNYRYSPPMHSVTLTPGQETLFLPYIEKEIERLAAHFQPIWEAFIVELRAIHAAIAAHPITRPSSSEKEMVETGHVTQQEMISRMEKDLVSLPKRTAYIHYSSSEVQDSPKIETIPLPPSVPSQELQARMFIVAAQTRAYGTAKEDIEKEVQKRRVAFGLAASSVTVREELTPSKDTSLARPKPAGQKIMVARRLAAPAASALPALTFDDDYLMLLYHFHFLTMKQIVRLLGRETSINNERRKIASLVKKGLIAASPLGNVKAGHPTLVYALSPKGIKFLEEEKGLTPGTRKGGFSDHTGLVNDALITLVLGCHDRRLRVCELKHERYFKSHGIKLGGNRYVEPDAFLHLQTEKTESIGICLEVDTGTESKEQVQEKLEKYVEMVQSGIYQQTFGLDSLTIAICQPGGKIDALRLWTKEVVEHTKELAALFVLTGVNCVERDPVEWITSPIWVDVHTSPHALIETLL